MRYNIDAGIADKLRNKRILVTGGTGLIGSHVVEALREIDANVYVSGRSIEKLKNAFMPSEKLHLIQWNTIDPIHFEFDFDYIFHAAGPMEGKVIKNTPVEVIKPNILGLINCLEIARLQGYGRVIPFSSVTVYGKTDYERVVSEDDTFVAENIDSLSASYSESKRVSEVIALSYYRQYGVEVVIPRFSTVYGATRFVPDTAFFEFIKKAKDGEDIVLNSPNLPPRDNIYIDDAVNGVLTMAAIGENGEAYNVSSNGDGGNYASVAEIAEIIADLNREKGKRVEVLYKEKRSLDNKGGLKLNNGKLKNLGWNNNVSLTDGIRTSIEELPV